MSWLSGRPIYSRNSLLQIYYQNQYTHKLMEIEETLAAQLHTQPEQQQSYFNPENTNNKIPSQFETQVSNTTRHTLPYNSPKQKQFPIKELKDKKLTASLDIQSIKKTKHSQSFSHIEKLSSRFDYKNVDKIDEREQNPNKDYKDLTLKLESALEKINSKNQKNEKNIKSNGEEIINRFKKQEEKKKKEIHQKKQNLDQNKVKELQDKPTINQYSEKLAKETGHKPIHLRLQQLMAEKKRKMEENQQRKKKQEEQEEQQFLQEYNKYAKRPQNLRSYEAYFNEMVKWQEKKTRAVKQKLQTKQSKELEGITFTPSLNQKSLKMVSSHHRLPIQQRAFLKKKQKVEVRKQKFKPQLNQK